jgi:Tol biopolymer transport system component
MTSLSKNGRYAVFTSSATDVVPGSTTPNSDVYRRDLSTNTTVQVTVRPNGAPSRGPGPTTADVSADGNLVAFDSYNTDLVAADGDDGETDLFIRNMTTGKTRWLSPGLPVGANPEGVALSPDGRWVSSRWADGSLHLTRVDTRVTSTVVTNGYAPRGSFSSRLGRFVFISSGTPYVRDLSTGVNTAIVTPEDGFVTNVTISGNGQFAAYDFFPVDGSPSLIFRVAL